SPTARSWPASRSPTRSSSRRAGPSRSSSSPRASTSSPRSQPTTGATSASPSRRRSSSVTASRPPIPTIRPASPAAARARPGSAGSSRRSCWYCCSRSGAGDRGRPLEILDLGDLLRARLGAGELDQRPGQLGAGHRRVAGRQPPGSERPEHAEHTVADDRSDPLAGSPLVAVVTGDEPGSRDQVRELAAADSRLDPLAHVHVGVDRSPARAHRRQVDEARPASAGDRGLEQHHREPVVDRLVGLGHRRAGVSLAARAGGAEQRVDLRRLQGLEGRDHRVELPRGRVDPGAERLEALPPAGEAAAVGAHVGDRLEPAGATLTDDLAAGVAGRSGDEHGSGHEPSIVHLALRQFARGDAGGRNLGAVIDPSTELSFLRQTLRLAIACAPVLLACTDGESRALEQGKSTDGKVGSLFGNDPKPPPDEPTTVAFDEPYPMPSCPSGQWCGTKALAEPLRQPAGPYVAQDFEGCPGGIRGSESIDSDERSRYGELPTHGAMVASIDVAATEARRSAGEQDACCYSWTEMCPGGRPLLEDGRPRVAELREGT